MGEIQGGGWVGERGEEEARWEEEGRRSHLSRWRPVPVGGRIWERESGLLPLHPQLSRDRSGNKYLRYHKCSSRVILILVKF